MGELMTTLRDLKLGKVTYLELLAFDKQVWTEDSYNDAIVNIFTRLNTAGRTLTRGNHARVVEGWLGAGRDRRQDSRRVFPGVAGGAGGLRPQHRNGRPCRRGVVYLVGVLEPGPVTGEPRPVAR